MRYTAKTGNKVVYVFIDSITAGEKKSLYLTNRILNKQINMVKVLQ